MTEKELVKFLGPIDPLPDIEWVWVDSGDGNGWWMNPADGSHHFCYIR